MAYSSDFIGTRNTAAQALDWLFASASLNAMVEESGSNPPSVTAPHSISLSPNMPDARTGRKLNLLMVEDNLADALLVREAIRIEGLPVEVFAAADGELAISFIESAENDPNAPSPDAAILDINLPKVDGFEVLRRIRASARYKHLPVIVLTSSDSPTDRSESARMGNGYFRKRPDYDEFMKIGPAIRQLLDQNGLL